MNIALINPVTYQRVAVLELYKSFIWTDRYNACGDFEGSFAMTKENFDLLKIGMYLYNSDSDRMMIIESVEIRSNVEEGDQFIIKGRSLESILDRRVISEKMTIGDNPGKNDNLQNGVKTILETTIINPAADTEGKKPRQIPNFIFETSTDPEITKLTLQSQYEGENVYEVINGICEDAKIGFKVTLNNKNQFVFKLFKGTNRSGKVKLENKVIFSPVFENIFNSSYIENVENFKNVAMIAGEEDGTTKKKITTYVGEAAGINRKEVYIEASDISQSNTGISRATYINMLKARGRQELKKEYKVSKTFDGEVDSDGLFKFNKDFYLGDLVEFVDAYNNSKQVRVDEFIMSEDENGNKSYPSFTVIDD